jgi:hypothetical protein
MTYGFFRHCLACDALWQGSGDSTCWLCGEQGTQCHDGFVYTASNMNGMTSEL